MPNTLTISLNKLHFHAYHGLYEEEKITGNAFEINMQVTYTAPMGIVREIGDTVNYVELFQLLKIEMMQPRQLLETLAMEIADHVHQSFPIVQKVVIAITKLHAPIAGFAGEVGVSYTKEFGSH